MNEGFECDECFIFECRDRQPEYAVMDALDQSIDFAVPDHPIASPIREMA
jgi:hypothetical protein